MAVKKSGSEETKVKDASRNSYVHSLAFQWLTQNRPDVIEACRNAGLKKYPKSGKSRVTVVLTEELKDLK